MKKILLLWMSVILFTLAACGGASAQPSTELDVTMTDFQFTPNQFTVPAGQEITLKAENTGAVVHNFVIMQQGTSAGDSFTDEDLPNVYWQVEIAPGGSADTSFVAPDEPGDYEVVCRTPGHVQAGMVAKMKVVAADQK